MFAEDNPCVCFIHSGSDAEDDPLDQKLKDFVIPSNPVGSRQIVEAG